MRGAAFFPNYRYLFCAKRFFFFIAEKKPLQTLTYKVFQWLHRHVLRLHSYTWVDEGELLDHALGVVLVATLSGFNWLKLGPVAENHQP